MSILVLVFLVNSTKQVTLVETYPTKSECQQRLNERLVEFGNTIVTIDCN